MSDDEPRHPTKRGHGQALAAGNQHVLAQLQRATGYADHHERFEHAVLGAAELMAVDHGDREHELDLLLQRVEGLARDRADGEHRADPRRYRCGAADRTGSRDPPASGTDELHRKLVTGEVGVLRAQRLDAVLDGGLARRHDLGEAPEQRLHLDGQAVEVHRHERNPGPPA